MDNTLEKTFNHIYRRVVRDKVFFESILPAEYKTLHELLSTQKPQIRLSSGVTHLLDPVEVRRLASILPWYLHYLVKLPWVFIYRREHWGGRFYLRKPDAWAARALSIVFGDTMASEKWVLTIDEMRRLISSFKTLIIVVVEANIETGVKAAYHGVEES